MSPDEPIRKVLPSMPTQQRSFERDVTLTAFVEIDDRGRFVEKGVTLLARLTSPSGDVAWTDIDAVQSSAYLPKVEYKTTIPLGTLSPGDYVLTIDANDASGDVIAGSRPLTIRVN